MIRTSIVVLPCADSSFVVVQRKTTDEGGQVDSLLASCDTEAYATMIADCYRDVLSDLS